MLKRAVVFLCLVGLGAALRQGYDSYSERSALPYSPPAWGGPAIDFEIQRDDGRVIFNNLIVEPPAFRYDYLRRQDGEPWRPWMHWKDADYPLRSAYYFKCYNTIQAAWDAAAREYDRTGAPQVVVVGKERP